MAEEFKVKVGVEVDASGIQGQLDKIKGGKLNVDLDISKASARVDELKKKIESLSNIKVNIGGLGNVSTSSGTVDGFVKNAKNQLKNVSDAFLKLQNIQKEIKVSRQNLSILDAKTDSQAIDNLTKKINGLITEYDKLYAAKSKSLSSSEISALNKEYSANIAPIKQTAEAAKELLSVQKQIGNLEVKIKGLDDNTDANQIRELNSQLLTLKNTYNELRASLNGQLSSGQLKSLNDAITSTENKLTQLEAKLADVKGKKATDISGNIGNFGIDNEADKIERSFNRIVKATEEAQAAMDRFQLAKEHLGSANQDFLNADTEEKKAAAIDNLIAKYDEYKTSLSAVKSQIELNTRAEKENAAAKKLESDKNTFSLGISKWLKNNSAAAEDFGGRLRKLQAELKTCDSVRFNGIKSEFKQITTEAELAGKTGLTFADRFKQQFSKLGSYFSAASVIMAGIQVGKEAIQNVIDIDTKMTELYRVTDLSTTQYSQLYDKLTVSAKEYGVALTDLISATADWSRAGFDADTAAGLAEVTSIYQHIADLDYDTSVENLLTAYKGFESELKNTYGDDAKSAAMHIADIYNEIDNNYATTAADIGEAVKRSASALSLAGNSLEETAGMVTGITEVTQDPEKAGNSLKVLSMRIRGMKGDLQDLGEEVDDNVENISQMQGKILNLTHGKVNIFEDDGSFKSTYEIMQGIANIYDDLTDSDRADLLETIAGKNRANEVAALIQNWDRVEQATESAANSTGSAMKEQEKYADSIQGRLNSLQSMWQQLSNTLISSDAVKFVVSSFTELLGVLDAIIDKIGGFGAVGLAGVLFNGFKKNKGIRSLISTFFKDIVSGADAGVNAASTLSTAFSKAGNTLKSFFKTPAGIATGIGLAVAAVSTVINLIDNAIEKTNQARQEAIDLGNNFGNSFQSFEEAYRNYSGKTNLTQEDEAALASAVNGTISALGDKAAALKDVAGAESEYSSNLEAIAKEELKQQQQIANDAKTAAKEQLTDFWADGVWSGIGTWFSGKNSKYDFKLPDESSKEWETIEDVVENENFKKYVDGIYGRDNAMGSHNLTKYFRFDKDSGLDGYIEQLNYVTEIRDKLSEKASETGDDSYLDSDAYKNASAAVDELSAGINEYVNQTYAAEKATYQLNNGIPKTIDEFYDMQDAVLSASASTVEGRAAIASFMENEYSGVFDLSSTESQIRQLQALTKDIDSIGAEKEKTFETLIDLKTKVNNGECSVGDYTKAVDDANAAINEIAKTDAGAANALRIQLGIEVDADGNVDDEISKLKDKFVKQLTDNSVEADVAEKFVDGLSKTELEAAVDLVASGEIDLKNIDTKNLDASIKQKIEDYSEYLKAIRFNLDIDAETKGLENFNTAMSESRAATGLTAESIQNIEDRYSDLEGYNPAGLFEKTTTGVRLNTEALRSLEEQYVATNKAASDQKLGALAKRYKEIEALRDNVGKDTAEYKDYQRQLDNLNDEIEAAKLAAAAYDGLTSSYNNWINAQSNGQAGDMYDQIVEGQEAAKKLAEEGKWGNTELQGYIEMFSAPDALDNATPEQYAEAWGKAINKSNRYFQEGTAGIDAFISDVAAANSNLVKMNDDGVWEIQPGFDVKDWANAAGVAESTVESIFGQMEEYGFDVPIGIDEASIDDLVAKADSASNALKSSMGEDFSIDVNTDVSSAEEANSEIEKLKAQRDEINNSSATVEVKEQGVEAVNASIQATIDKQIELEQPTYMQLDTSQVKSTMIDALTALQNYQNAVDEVKNLEMQQDAGIEIDTTQLDNAKEKVDETAQAIAQLDGDVKIAIGLDASDGVDDIKKKIESGEVKLTVDTDVNKTATEELASNIEKIESKDVTITAKVEGLDDVKELNKNIDIAAKVDGNIEDLTKFTEAAKGLNDVNDNITTTVSANVYGNLDKNKNLDKLSSFVDNAKELDGVKSSYVDVVANVNGNLDENSINVDNLSEFAEGAKALQGVSSSDVSVKAHLESSGLDNNWLGNNSVLDNINKFAESAERLSGVGDASVTVTANLESEGVGNNIFGNNSTLDNLNKFAESAKNLQGVGDASVTIQANLDASGVGNDLFSSSNSTIDNLEKFAEGAKKMKSVGDASATVTANLNGNIGNGLLGSNSKLDNLEKFADGARKLNGVKDVSATITANLNGNIGDGAFGAANSKLANLGAFADGAKKLDGIQDKSVSLTANINGNIGTSGDAINNLPSFASTASTLQNVSSKDVTVTANVGGNITSGNVTTLSQFGAVVSSLPTNKTVSVNTNVDTAAISNVVSTLQGLSNSGVMQNYSATITVNTNVDTSAVDSYSPAAKTGKVAYEVDPSAVNAWNAPDKTGTVTYNPSVTALTDSQLHKTGTITYKATIIGGPGGVDGTAHVNGTTNRSFAQGSWGTKEDGVALMGELGQELVVRDGRWFTVGDNGAEFVGYKKDDIIFNADQTRELFEKGKITHGSGRGRALAEGTAFANVGSGTWRPGGIGGNYSGSSSKKTSSKSSSSKSSSSNSSSSSSSSSSNDAKEFEETLDWIETAIDRIERAISRLDKTATSTYKNWTKRGTALNDQIAKTREEIDLQQRAYDRYMAQAGKIGLSENYAAKVRDGTIDIETITDEDLNDKISQYKEWYLIMPIYLETNI